MDKYNLFAALADSNRALGFLSLVGFVQLLGLGIGLWPGALRNTTSLLLSLGAALAFALFTNRLRFFRTLSDLVVYHSFIAFAVQARSKKE